MKNKILSILFFVVSAVCFAQKNKRATFNELDMVQIPSGSYIIGEDVQTYTAKRNVKSFLINNTIRPTRFGFMSERIQKKTATDSKIPVRKAQGHAAEKLQRKKDSVSQ